GALGTYPSDARPRRRRVAGRVGGRGRPRRPWCRPRAGSCGVEQLCGHVRHLDDADGRGYAYVRRGDARIATVAATDDDTAAELLWRCLAIEHDGQRGVEHINGEQQWAVRVALAARLRLEPAGPVCWRGRRPPPAYLASGAFL